MASVYRKGGRWWVRFKGADGRWRGAPAKAMTKPAARLEALEREKLARHQREGLVPSDDNRRRTFGQLMDVWQERYGSRLRSQTIQLSVEKHLRPALGKLLLGGAAAALPALLNSKIGQLSPSSLNHLRAYCHRLYAVASMRSVGWWMGPNPVNRLEVPKFKEPKRRRPTVAAEDVPCVLAALSPAWRPLFATAFFLGLRRGELLALQKEDVDLRDWTITVRRSNGANVTKGGDRGDDGTVPIPEPLRPYLDAAIQLSPSKWVFPAADGTQRAPDTNLKAVLQRALGRAAIVDGYEHRCRKPGCGHVDLASDDRNRRCPKDNRALWVRPLPKKGIVFHSLRHTTATLLARAKVHPSVAQKILRHANIETTLAIYTHLDGIEDMRAAVAKLDFGPLEERAPAPIVPLRKTATFATNLLPAARIPKGEAPDRAGKASKIRGLDWSGRLDLNQRPLAPQASALPGCATPRHGSSGGSVVTSAPGAVNRGLQALLFKAFFNTCEGRNVRTRRAEISISCPVCGLRPTRDFFSRTTKFPNPESLIFSPRSSVSFSVSKTISTISADSFLENPTLLQTLSMTSALVMPKQYTDTANSVKPRRK